MIKFADAFRPRDDIDIESYADERGYHFQVYRNVDELMEVRFAKAKLGRQIKLWLTVIRYRLRRTA